MDISTTAPDRSQSPTSEKIRAKAQSALYNYTNAYVTETVAFFEDRLFEEEYAELSEAQMRWHVQRWLWNFLCELTLHRLFGT